MKTFQARDRKEWRSWLSANHGRESEIWLVFHRKETGKPCIEYGESVEEALCFGWIDSIIKKIDESRYARKFTPRTEGSVWSPSNIKRVEKLLKEGRITGHGLRLIEAAKRSGKWNTPAPKPVLSYEMVPEFSEALKKNKKAREAFEKLAPSYRKRYILWVGTAKRPEVREKRIVESVRLLSEGKKLGLK